MTDLGSIGLGHRIGLGRDHRFMLNQRLLLQNLIQKWPVTQLQDEGEQTK